MEGDIPPKPYRHPNQSFKNIWVILILLAVPDLLHSGWSMNIWLAESVGVACSLPVLALAPPRLSSGKMVLLSALMYLIVAAQYLAHLYFRANR